MQLPELLLARARFLATGEGEPWTPPALRDASTVILLRENPRLEVFVMRRALTMAFAPGMYVFPGGSVDARDSVDCDRDRAFARAAIREVFEETSVTLQEQDLLTWSRWVTPEFEPMRFDVHFYIARLPKDAHALDVSGEADLVRWVEPHVALGEFAAGQMPMLPPTVETLRSLAQFTSIDEVLRQRPHVDPLLPRLLEHDGSLVWKIVHADTGEVISYEAQPPHASEALGVQP